MSLRKTSILLSLLDLREELKPGLKRPKLKPKKQQNIAANENIEAEKEPTDTEKGTHGTEEAKNYAKEAKHSAEEAKVLLLKTKKDS